jgi:competence ComEA-like helix-hairpin-helix protein
MATTALAADLPEGEGREILLRACTGCHKAEAFLGYRHTKDEYSAIVVRMGQRGAPANSEELEAIAAYLSKNFLKMDDPGKLNINKASAQEIEKALHLTQKEAEAIVTYRDRHGTFQAVGDLYLIYGLDGTKIAAQKDKIGF